MVSIPYRQARYFQGLKNYSRYFKVSIPYRQARYTKQKDKNNILKRVSIPYRQARYKGNPCRASTSRKKFQFLIGRLGTKRGNNMTKEELKFQFLIGRLGTLKLHQLQPRFDFRFNSLQVGQVRKNWQKYPLFDISFNSLQVGQVLYVFSVKYE